MNNNRERKSKPSKGKAQEPVMAWTDYPLDIRNPYGFLYHIELVSFDGDKYVVVKHTGTLYSMKYGYIYTDESKEEVIPFSVFKALPQNPNAYQNTNIIAR